MYESFYGLREKPFSILPNGNLIYWGGMHRMAFAMLEFGVFNHAGFTVVTGEIGSGKTTLVRHLLTRLGSEVTVGLITNTPRGRDELLRWVMMSLRQPVEGDYLTVFKRFSDFLQDQARRGRWTVLVIDEAQNLGLEELEELRMLSNLNHGNREVLQLILVGQHQLKDLLRNPRLEQFVQRVSVDFHLKALEEHEVPEYINFRLSAVGAQRELFTNEAASLIAKASRGVPRVINILCDMALVYGLSTSADLITDEIVSHVIQDKQTYGVFPVTAT
jgi:general secretion pathway protein A